MTARAPLLVIFVLVFLGVTTAVQEETQDYFLPPPCGGGSNPSSLKEPIRPALLGVTEQTLLHHRVSGAMPVYPEGARATQIRGVVELHVEVNNEGKVTRVQRVWGPPVLARAATRAVRRWRYRPVLVNDTPVEVSGEVLLTFRLKQKPAVVDGGKTHLRRATCVGPWIPLHRVEPEYPHMAKIAHVQGDVVLRILVDKLGNVSEATAISGHPMLVPAAIDAVKQWKYPPYVLGTGPVAVEEQVTVRFHM